MSLVVITCLIIKNDTANTTYYHETIQYCCENDSKEILNIYSLRLLSIVLSMQGSAL